MAALAALAALLCASPAPAAAAPAPAMLAWSDGLSNNAVLQRAPARAAVYGLASAGAPLPVVTLVDVRTGRVQATVQAEPAGAAAGAAPRSGLCEAQCAAAGHCCVGNIASCQRPSCAMGCAIASATASVAACQAQCANMTNKCAYTVAGMAFNMCEVCAALPNGTACGSCTQQDECALGCQLAHAAAPQAWKALLPAMPPGGNFTLTARSSAASTTLTDITFGDVFFCSGQSNM